MMNNEKLKIVKLKEFDPEQAEGSYTIADFEEQEFTCSDAAVFSFEDFFAMKNSDRIEVEYKEKSPCCNRD